MWISDYHHNKRNIVVCALVKDLASREIELTPPSISPSDTYIVYTDTIWRSLIMMKHSFVLRICHIHQIFESRNMPTHGISGLLLYSMIVGCCCVFDTNFKKNHLFLTKNLQKIIVIIKYQTKILCLSEFKVNNKKHLTWERTIIRKF